jgi:hypothetical protein
MLKLVVVIGLACVLAGCAEIPIKDGELAIGKDTTASIEDVGAVRVTNRY